jgi:hypothetical protein
MTENKGEPLTQKIAREAAETFNKTVSCKANDIFAANREMMWGMAGFHAYQQTISKLPKIIESAITRALQVADKTGRSEKLQDSGSLHATDVNTAGDSPKEDPKLANNLSGGERQSVESTVTDSRPTEGEACPPSQLICWCDMCGYTANRKADKICWCEMCGYTATVKPDKLFADSDQVRCPMCETVEQFSFLLIADKLPDHISPDDPTPVFPNLP